MDKNKILQIALPILFLGVIWVIFMNVKKPAAATNVKKPAVASVKAAALITPSAVSGDAVVVPGVDIVPTDAELAVLIAEDSMAAKTKPLDLRWGDRDPFNPGDIQFVEAPKPTPKAGLGVINPKNLKLGGILWSGPKPSAIINNAVVGVGVAVGSLVVKDIKEGVVTLTDGTTDVVLTMKDRLNDAKLVEDPAQMQLPAVPDMTVMPEKKSSKK